VPDREAQEDDEEDQAGEDAPEAEVGVARLAPAFDARAATGALAVVVALDRRRVEDRDVLVLLGQASASGHAESIGPDGPPY